MEYEVVERQLPHMALYIKLKFREWNTHMALLVVIFHGQRPLHTQEQVYCVLSCFFEGDGEEVYF